MCFPPVQNGQEMRIFLFIHRNRPDRGCAIILNYCTYSADRSLWRNKKLFKMYLPGWASFASASPCLWGSESIFWAPVKADLWSFSLPLHLLGTEPLLCWAIALSISIRIPSLEEIILYLDPDLLLWLLHFSPLLSSLVFFHNKPKFHGTEYLGRSCAPIFLTLGDHNVSFSPLTLGVVYRTVLLTFHLNDCFQNTYFLHLILMQGMDKGLRLICKSRSLSHSSHITFIRFITMQEWRAWFLLESRQREGTGQEFLKQIQI